ncbi:MAG: pirin family protein [Pacificimonas sp.]|jgi:redox-sensitive bicupin YhaK (pirin superfamily)|nr:pirin family protein [Pacificimonas sp.]
MIINGREKDLGDGFAVRRVLPSARRRTVGPFIFWDHFGPKTYQPGERFDVRPHPHIDLSTITYLFDGEIMHRDSLGSAQAIEPGAVNWMTAGTGIVHSERTSEAREKDGQTLEGIQSWVAMPKDAEQSDPGFFHHPADTLPRWDWPGARAVLIAGNAYGHHSPVEYPGGIFYVDVDADTGAAFAFPEGHAEKALYVAHGQVTFRGESVSQGQMLFADAAGPDEQIECKTNARLLLIGGAPLDGERHIWWNFVSSDPQRIQKAADDWRADRFPPVPGDDSDRIPLPQDGPPPPVQAGS